jgi:hypothetical protein
MKKVTAEVDMQQLISELQTRQAALEARVEKLDPTPKLQVREPYPEGSRVYSIADPEARSPFTVVGYPGPGRILVIAVHGEPARELSLASVVPLASCKNAQLTPDQVHEELYAHMDPKTREYWEGRRTAEIEAKTTPFTPPLLPQRRYGPTWYPLGE